MKKTILTLALALLGFGASAQTVLGGTIGMQHSGNRMEDNNTAASTSITVMPKVGYWIADNLQLGAQFGFGYTNNREWFTNDDYYSLSQWNFAIAPYLRYNVATLGKATLFAEAQAALTITPKSSLYNSLTDESKDGAQKATTCALTVVPGLNYSLSNHLSLDLYVDLLGLGYYYTSTSENGTDYSRHGLSLSADASTHTLNDHLSLFRIGFNYSL